MDPGRFSRQRNVPHKRVYLMRNSNKLFTNSIKKEYETLVVSSSINLKVGRNSYGLTFVPVKLLLFISTPDAVRLRK